MSVWTCRCGYSSIPSVMDFCSACWADRTSGSRVWARLSVMDFSPGGEVPDLSASENSADLSEVSL